MDSNSQHNPLDELIAHSNKTNDSSEYLMVAFLYTLMDNNDKMTEFLDKFINNFNRKTALSILFNLGYMAELRHRHDNTILIKKQNCNNFNGLGICRICYENCIKFGMYKSANNLGKLYIDYPDNIYNPGIKFGIDLLILASNNDIITAIDNLIQYYENNYQLQNKYIIKKYGLTKNINDIKNPIIMILNKDNFKQYYHLINMLEEYGYENLNILGLLTFGPIIILDTCSICSKNENCYKLICGHSFCDNCYEPRMKTYCNECFK